MSSLTGEGDGNPPSSSDYVPLDFEYIPNAEEMDGEERLPHYRLIATEGLEQELVVSDEQMEELLRNLTDGDDTEQLIQDENDPITLAQGDYIVVRMPFQRKSDAVEHHHQQPQSTNASNDNISNEVATCIDRMKFYAIAKINELKAQKTQTESDAQQKIQTLQESAKKEAAKHETEVGKFSQEIALLQSKIKEYESDAEQTRIDREELMKSTMDECNNLKNELQNKESELSKLQGTVVELERQCTDKDASIEEKLREEKLENERILKELEEKSIKLEDALTKFKTENDQLRLQIQEAAEHTTKVTSKKQKIASSNNIDKVTNSKGVLQTNKVEIQRKPSLKNVDTIVIDDSEDDDEKNTYDNST